MYMIVVLYKFLFICSDVRKLSRFRTGNGSRPSVSQSLKQFSRPNGILFYDIDNIHHTDNTTGM